jgi:hypothetical protein
MWRRRFLLGLAAIPAGWALCFAPRNRVIVTNEAGQYVRGLTVEVCDTTIRFGDLSPGESRSARFGTPADEDLFTVHGRLEDGTLIDDDCGYVVHEDYASVFRLTIGSGGAVKNIR